MSPRVRRRVTTALVGLALVGQLAGRGSGDDTVVDEEPVPGVNMPNHGGMPAVDLGQMFDVQVFANNAFGGMEVFNPDAAQGQRPADDNAAAVQRRLEPVRRLAEARIARADRIVGLSEQQKKKLTAAMESDLRRLADAIAEARGRYVGRIVKMDPRHGGFDEAGQQAVNQAQQDIERCRQLFQAAGGPESLLAKVLPGTLDEPQAKKYSSVMQGRAACRWQAVVAAGLAAIDEQAGFTQKQHDAVVALLVAAPPPEADDSPGSDQAGVPAMMRVAQRLVALDGDPLAAILDPRQRQVVAGAATGQFNQMGAPFGAVEFPAGMGMGMGGGFFRIEP